MDDRTKTGISRHFSLVAILFIPVCVAINVVGGQIDKTLNLPVYLDSIGTMLTGMLAGPWVGAVTGLLTNLINGIFKPTQFFFAVVSVAIGITAGLLSRHGMFSAWWKQIISALVFAVISTVIAAPILVLVFGGITGSTKSLITAALLATGQKIWGAVFSSQFITDVIDKGFSLFMALFIIKRISPRYLAKLIYGDKYIRQ